MKIATIIVAAGSGQRMGSTTPKQFMLLEGRPVLMQTIDAMSMALCEISGESIVNNFIIVLPESQIVAWESLCEQYNFTTPHQTVAGGESRFESVKNGLCVAEGADIVLVHDGVRPLVDANTVSRVLQAAVADAAAVPVVNVDDSLRRIVNKLSITVNRSEFRAVQTPQAFSRELLVAAYAQPFDPSFTDDASVVEHMGHAITLTEGDSRNIKITTPVDLAFAALLYRQRVL